MRFFSRNNRIGLVIICFGFIACRSVYSSMEPVSVKDDCLTNLQPQFRNELYKAQVAITNHTLSGLLLIKEMPDKSMRVVFSTEMGVKFFDFKFMENGEFKVIDILKRLNKKVVITALREDFELLLMQERGKIPACVRTNELYFYHGYEKGKKQAWYLTDRSCRNLMGAELSSTRKPLVQLRYFHQGQGSPDSIFINHLNFKFNIALKKLDR